MSIFTFITKSSKAKDENIKTSKARYLLALEVVIAIGIMVIFFLVIKFLL